MFRSVFAGTALTTVVLVTLPFFGGPGVDVSTLLSSRPDVSAAAPVITSVETRAGVEPSRESITDLADRRANVADAEKRAAEEAAERAAEAAAEAAAAAEDEAEEAEESDGGTGSGSGSSPQPTATTAPAPKPTATTTPAPKPSPTKTAAPAPKPSPTATTPACPSAISGSTNGAPGRSSAQGVAGTTSADLNDFAQRFNAIRVANCLAPIPFANIRYDSCMEDRLFWMAEDPSTDPMSAWGHKGQVSRSDGVADTGCDGNLAGGSGNTGATVAQKWWDSGGHRASLYKPGTSIQGACILFAMTHGGVPNEPYSFTRAAARWVNC